MELRIFYLEPFRLSIVHESYSPACQIVNFSNVSFEPLSTDRVLAKGAQPAARSAPKELLRLVPKVSKLMDP
jgi:hypothetical protein